MRVDVVPATADGLRSALGRVFNPHLGSPAPSILPHSGAEGPRDPLEPLETAHRDWASDCALVEPISFALAERLRCRYPALRSESPSLDFALLASLPGSWVGPEGLRFDPALRRHLLNRLGTRGAEDRDAAMQEIDGAFDEAERALQPEKTVFARAVLDFARNTARVVALASDEAWAEIVALEDAKLMAEGVTANVLDRLRLPEHRNTSTPDLGGPEHTEAIVLPEEPQTGAMHQALQSQALRPLTVGANSAPAAAPDPAIPGPAATGPAPFIAVGQWTPSVPDIRIRAPGPAPPSAASFMAGGRFLLMGGSRSGSGPALRLVDGVVGTVWPVDLPESFADVLAIAGARDTPVAVAISSAGLFAIIRLDGDTPLKAGPIVSEVQHDIPLGQLSGSGAWLSMSAAVDAAGEVLCVAPQSQSTVMRFALRPMREDGH